MKFSIMVLAVRKEITQDFLKKKKVAELTGNGTGK